MVAGDPVPPVPPFPPSGPDSIDNIITYYTNIHYAAPPLRDILCNPYLSLNSSTLNYHNLVSLGFTTNEATTYTGAVICRTYDNISNLSAYDYIYIPIPSKVILNTYWDHVICTTVDGKMNQYIIRIIYINSSYTLRIMYTRHSPYIKTEVIQKLEKRKIVILDSRGIILEKYTPPDPVIPPAQDPVAPPPPDSGLSA